MVRIDAGPAEQIIPGVQCSAAHFDPCSGRALPLEFRPGWDQNVATASFGRVRNGSVPARPLAKVESGRCSILGHCCRQTSGQTARHRVDAVCPRDFLVFHPHIADQLRHICHSRFGRFSGPRSRRWPLRIPPTPNPEGAPMPRTAPSPRRPKNRSLSADMTCWHTAPRLA
jgi:hypothetical protein